MSLIPTPSGTTKVAALLGYPATYSQSPALHNAAYAEMDFDGVYVVLPVKPEHLPVALEAVSALNFMGASVTIPHKETAATLCDVLSDHAKALSAVNCLVVKDGLLHGYNTDGEGFLRSLRQDLAFDPAGKRCVVIGAGGAARAVIAALGAASASEIVVVNRSEQRAEDALLLAPDVARVGSVADLESANLVVNATPLGMVGDQQDVSPVESGHFRNGQVVVDLIYKPERTVFLKDAEAAGARVANGMGMLIHQAAAQIEIWTGKSPSIAAMRAAVEH